MMTEHWANRYIGKRWELGADGPDAYDCWGLARAVYRDIYGIDLPVVEIAVTASLRQAVAALQDHPERANWTEIERPEDGCMVLMRQRRYPSHCGIWLDVDGGGVLHSLRGSGVIFSNLRSLRLSGWSGISYYRRVA